MPRQRIVCFPHAGGAASFFRGWQRLLPADIELLAVRYPGREDRIDEPCLVSMNQLADQCADAILPLLDRPLTMFGHSLGASVAHEVAVRLERAHGFTLSRLFVSGREAPQLLRAKAVREDSDEAVLSRARQLGGATTAALDDPYIRELWLPAIRADFRLADAYLPRRIDVVNAPVTGFASFSDPLVTRESVCAWSEATWKAFDFQGFAGDHFYLVPQAPAVVAAISDRMAAGVG
jgi:pyochelin biosynthesis protein PchC